MGKPKKEKHQNSQSASLQKNIDDLKTALDF